jgi:DNA polymerase
MRTLAIDLETYSSNDIKYSVYKYVEAPDFEILLFAYAFDDDPVRVVDLAQGETLPDDVKSALYDKNVIKTAFNANFEINCLKKYFPDLPEEQWECDRILSLYNSYPPHLAAVAKAMHFDEDRQKDTRGKALIRYFCLPCKPTKANGGRTRNYPKDAPDKWEIFKEYNRQDVVVERAIRDKLVNLRPPDFEHENWLIDQAINRNGIMVNQTLVDNAIRLSGEYREKLLARAMEITGLDNPNSPLQVKGWLEERLGRTVDSLSKAAVADMLAEDIPGDVREMLSIRQKISKSSIKKYDAMRMAACQDSRIRGMFQFYGAARTGRFAGRIVQLQNLPRNSMPDLDLARSMVLDGDIDTMELCYDDVQDVLSQLIRTALEAPPGKRFIVADFSAIEARVIAWLAGEEWEMKAFAEGKDIYCATASAMFGVPVVKHKVNAHLRQKGKVAVLACGYGGGIGALKAMGADKMGLTDDELQTVVRKWREASPHIVKLWADVENAAMNAVSGIPTTIKQHGLHFHVEDDALYIELPSGRHLVYLHPHLGKNRFGSDAIIYTGLGGSKTTAGRWGALETYGGKLVENCLAGGTLVLTDHGLIPIELIDCISKDIRIWDGVSYVQHEGVIDKGVQHCIKIDGLYMTPEHLILTKKGWTPGAKAHGLTWENVASPFGYQEIRGQHSRIDCNRQNEYTMPVFDILNCGPRHRFAVFDPKTKSVRLVHNCVQAIARDCLCSAMKRLTDADYKICAHIHDEVILEMPVGKGSLDDAVRIMCQNEPWNKGLVMNADGFEAKYYQKD